MAETYISIEKIRSLAEVGTIDEFKDSTDMNEIFAACAIASKKYLGLIPYDEQLTAAAELTKGRITEMKTGEGKTLCAAFAASYMAKNGHNVRILTFNDYLAKRDSEWMKPIYDALGISSACILHSTDIADKKEMYKNQIVYITAREAGFDFLRDFVANTPEDCVQTDFDFCIADEADSMMIDEARVPLVIAGETAVKPDEKLPEVYEFVKDFDSSMYEMEVKKIILRHAKEVYITADHSKLGRLGGIQLSDLEQADYLICDRPLTETMQNEMNAYNVKVLVAD